MTGRLEDAMRSFLRRSPRPLQNAARNARRAYRRARFRARELVRPVRLTDDDVERTLRACGLTEGDTVFFQASMSVFGSFDEGPTTVLRALERTVGSTGLVAMPAFPLEGPAIQYLDSDPLFDAGSTPSRMGAISESFRRLPGTLRSIHPTHSLAVRGTGAPELVADHEHAETPFGHGTPFMRLVERDALQLFFGCGTGPLTMYHAFECTREPPFPLGVFSDSVFDARCLDHSGRSVRVRTLVHDPQFVRTRIDSNAHLQALIRKEFIEGGHARRVELGKGEILAIRLRSMFEEFERLLKKGITIYECELPVEQPTLKPQNRVKR